MPGGDQGGCLHHDAALLPFLPHRLHRTLAEAAGHVCNLPLVQANCFPNLTSYVMWDTTLGVFLWITLPCIHVRTLPPLQLIC